MWVSAVFIENDKNRRKVLMEKKSICVPIISILVTMNAQSKNVQMVAERQRSELTPSIPVSPDSYGPPPSYDEVKSNGSDHTATATATQKAMYFLAEVHRT
jgi:hypothetical protein